LNAQGHEGRRASGYASLMPRFAALQLAAGADVGENLRIASELLEAAAGAGAAVALLPENFAFMGRGEGDKLQVAEAPGSGPIQDFLAGSAARLKLWIIGGTIALKSATRERTTNTCLVHDATGQLRARYDKIHLFDVDVPGKRERYHESAYVQPGRDTVLVDTPAGRVGLSVCYDVRFPELYRRLSAAGAEILVVPSAFTAPTGRAHWETLLRARAIENLSFVVASAQAGIHESGRETYGDSLIVDFWGRILSRLPHGRGIVTAELDRAALAAARTSFPALTHRVLSA
jgi:deaminated glutathione amidase